MKKKPNYTLNNQKPLRTHGNVNGPITSYIMDPVDLEKYRAIPKPNHELEKILNRSFTGGDIA